MHNSQEFYENWISLRIAEELSLPVHEISLDQPLGSMGVSSQQFLMLSGELEDLMKTRFDPTLLFEYPTIQDLAKYLASVKVQNHPNEVRKMDFSLFFFSVLKSEENPYAFIEEVTKFADQAQFHGVWLPERHFHKLGGGSPNPALLCASLARQTKQIRLKAGSVVAPLHDAIRTVEDWSMLDQLTNGRVEFSIASGWHVDDFALSPMSYENRKEILFERLTEIKKIWSGDKCVRLNGAGQKIEIKTYPRPVQKKAPIWITAISNPESFKKAGEIGVPILTCLLNQDVEELSSKIKIYRESLKIHGHPRQKVALFIHTFVGESDEHAKKIVQEPFREYLKSTLDLIGHLTSHHPGDMKIENMQDDQKEALLQFAFERYFSERSLMGSIEKVKGMIQKLKNIGIDEVACLVDFGVDTQQVMQSLKLLSEVKNSFESSEHELRS